MAMTLDTKMSPDEATKWVQKTFGPEYELTSQGLDFVTFDHKPTGAHIHILRDYPWKRYKMCVWKDATHSCTTAKTLDDAINRIKSLDITKAIE